MPVTQESFSSKSPLEFQEYFSESFAEARQKFRWAAEALKAVASVELHEIAVVKPDYTMDIAVVRGAATKGLVVHTSGTHGVEGYSGSAIQIAALHEMFCSQTRPEATCVFVHAVNPFGMANFRRVNENNVDLNRNALTPEGLQEVLDRDSNIAGYDDFQHLFVPHSAPSWLWVNITGWAEIVYLIARYGMRHMKKAMVAATYTRETGVFFGGKEVQASHRFLRGFLESNFGSVPGGEVVWIDVHTGLGPTGVDTILTCKAARPSVEGAFPGASIQCTDDAGEADGSIAAGYDLTRGLLDGDFYKSVFKSSGGQASALIATQEFGTVPAAKVARAMVIENRGFHCDVEHHDYWRTFTRDAFYVRTPDWKRAVAERGRLVLSQAQALCKQRSGL